MGNRVIHISDADAASDFASLLDRVRAGDEVVIEHDAHPVAVLRPAPPAPAAPGDTVNSVGRERTEFRWLALNRERYAGRWVALDGDQLLAVGDSAQEVYAAIANHRRTPLVTRVEPEDEVYFAGW
jgi:antitoxin (DNA-binding transcriptional repressor) of toxin-antitoxin stability system